MRKIRVGIVGFGNLGKGVYYNLINNGDFKIIGIFTKRNPQTILENINAPIYSVAKLIDFKDKIDVLFLCNGSYNSVIKDAIIYCQYFNIIDAFDTHQKTPSYYKRVNDVAIKYNKLSLISCGWDPGLFSIFRLIFSSFNGENNVNCFWGKGISQGHTNALLSVKGIIDAVEFTLPSKIQKHKVKYGENANEYDSHKRICYVCIDKNANKSDVKNQIQNIKYYFLGYKVKIKFTTKNRIEKLKRKIYHKGQVIANGYINNKLNYSALLKLKMPSNPLFTASIMVAYSKALYKLFLEKNYGAITVFDIPLKYLIDCKNIEIIKKYL